MSYFPKVDLHALAAQVDEDLDAALEALQALYREVDRRNAENTRTLDLPCHRGCDMCCHESVFLTPLEFFSVWDYAQRELSDETRQGIIVRGLALYAEHQAAIALLQDPPQEGRRDHFEVARKLRFTCPFLGAQGACLVYPARELYARLFGSSFNEGEGIFGCHLVGEHLAGKTVSLLRVRPMALKLSELPLTFMRQIYPYYLHMLYG
ncbi:MAG: hypothetical protein R3C68_03440 [Myxococcota bacterium]